MVKILILFFSFIIITTNLNANEKEDALKGVVLQRINQFITYEDNKTEFTICVDDNKDMFETFKDLYKNRKYKNLPIKIKSVKCISEIEKCDIFYVKNKKKTKRFQKLKNKKIPYLLLVTEDIDMLDEGFMLAIYFKNNKIQFAINHQAINDAKLKVNYRLLKVASKVINPLKN